MKTADWMSGIPLDCYAASPYDPPPAAPWLPVQEPGLVPPPPSAEDTSDLPHRKDQPDVRRRLIFRMHATRRMFERRVGVEEIRRVVEAGDIVEDYPDDTPYPSRLLLGWHRLRPLHVVAADVPESDETIIVTVYQPNADEWDPSFRYRR